MGSVLPPHTTKKKRNAERSHLVDGPQQLAQWQLSARLDSLSNHLKHSYPKLTSACLMHKNVDSLQAAALLFLRAALVLLSITLNKSGFILRGWMVPIDKKLQKPVLAGFLRTNSSSLPQMYRKVCMAENLLHRAVPCMQNKVEQQHECSATMFRWFLGWICVTPTCFGNKCDLWLTRVICELELPSWCHFYTNRNDRIFKKLEYSLIPWCAWGYRTYQFFVFYLSSHHKCKSGIYICTCLSADTPSWKHCRAPHSPGIHQLFVHLSSYQWQGLNISLNMQMCFFINVHSLT